MYMGALQNIGMIPPEKVRFEVAVDSSNYTTVLFNKHN